MEELKVKAMVARIESFFATRGKLPSSCSSNGQCNAKFANIDKALFFLASDLANNIAARAIPSYGIAVRKPTSVLTTRCCSCGGGQNNYTSRNAMRSSMEQILKNWLSAAKKAIQSGDFEVSESQQLADAEKFAISKTQTVSKKYLK